MEKRPWIEGLRHRNRNIKTVADLIKLPSYLRNRIYPSMPRKTSSARALVQSCYLQGFTSYTCSFGVRFDRICAALVLHWTGPRQCLKLESTGESHSQLPCASLQEGIAGLSSFINQLASGLVVELGASLTSRQSLEECRIPGKNNMIAPGACSDLRTTPYF
jgi:hypothetical protein